MTLVIIYIHGCMLPCYATILVIGEMDDGQGPVQASAFQIHVTRQVYGVFSNVSQGNVGMITHVQVE